MIRSNYNHNKAEIEKFHKELQALVDDILEIDIKVLNKAVNKGVAYAKEETNVITGFMRRSWRSAPAVKSKTGGVTKNIVNKADYASYVNYGHRVVRNNKTVGFSKGQYILERTMNQVEKELIKEFEKEVERVRKKHDK